jgi:hypothetical protein
MSSYRKGEIFEAYRPAVQELELIIGDLCAFEREAHEHGEIEKHLEKRGMELMRQLYQCWLNRVSAAEKEQERALGSDGQPRRYARVRKRHLMSVFGPVELCRLGYSDRTLESVFPLDAQLNLPVEHYSHGLRERVGEAVARGAYQEAVDQIDQHTGGHVPKRQAEQLTQGLAADFEDFYRQRKAQSSQPEGLLVMSADGKGIVMRHEDLREATKAQAQKASHKLGTRLSRGEKRNRKRMATVASVYEVARHMRSAEQIMLSDANTKPAPAPKPTDKRVWASVERSVREVLDEVFAEARRHDAQGQRTWVMLVDGHEGQLREVYAAIKRHGAKVTVVQDFVHVLEYLWSAAWCLHREGDAAAESWVRDHALGILRGKVSDVAAGMRRSATRRALSQEDRKPIDTCAEYLLKNRTRLDYAQALEQGLPIATGVIEGACRHLVKQRMECSGARWSLKGAEAVLRLRALCMSGDWNQYLAFHKHAERLRNYPAPDVQLQRAA